MTRQRRFLLVRISSGRQRFANVGGRFESSAYGEIQKYLNPLQFSQNEAVHYRVRAFPSPRRFYERLSNTPASRVRLVRQNFMLWCTGRSVRRQPTTACPTELLPAGLARLEAAVAEEVHPIIA
jgi:hypothetical protein